MGFRAPLPPVSLTRVQADTDAHGHVGHVPHLEAADGTEDVQRHVGDLRRVPVAVGNRKPRRHHVCVTDGLHLGETHMGKGRFTVLLKETFGDTFLCCKRKCLERVYCAA